MANGNLQIYGAILKLNNVFKAREVIDATGLSKQLVDYHLKKLVGEGLIERDGQKYALVARNDLITAMMDAGQNAVVGRFPDKPETFNKKKANDIIDISVILRCAELPGHVRLKAWMNTSLDEMINEMQAAKRYLNTKKISEKSALKQAEEQLSWIKETAGKYLGLANLDDLDQAILDKDPS